MLVQTAFGEQLFNVEFKHLLISAAARNKFLFVNISFYINLYVDHIFQTKITRWDAQVRVTMTPA
jgi:hypothetical protein